MTGRFPEPDQIFEDKYRVERLLGSGGFARVYLAEQIDLGRKVAIKILSLRVNSATSPETSEDESALESIALRFEREARIISQLNSAQTITIYDYGRTGDGLLYMVMEFVDGVELSEIAVPIAPRRALKILRQVLQSLHEAHARDLLHRDLKPANIMVYEHYGQKDQVKLLDFGIAKAIGDVANGAGADLTATDSLIGTPRYMSPEQIRGKDMGPASDIYSLGLVTYELLMGSKAITNTDSIEILGAHLAPESFRIPREDILHPQLVRLVNKMLSKELSERYASVSEVLEDLDAVEQLHGDLRLAGPPDITRPPGDETAIADLDESFIEAIDDDFMGSFDHFDSEPMGDKRTKRAVALVVLLVVVLVGIGFVLWQDSSPAETKEALVEETLEGAEEVEAPPVKPMPVVTVIRTRPSGASVWSGDRLIGMAPVQFTSERYEFPLTVRATFAEQSVEKTLEKPGGEFWLDIAVPADEDALAERAGTSVSDEDTEEPAQEAAAQKNTPTAPVAKPRPKPRPMPQPKPKPKPKPEPADNDGGDTLKYLPLE
ncbi:serine/threonine protein kinase [Bradymonas sediminis]|uniref:Protein kinase domain-containing protein n=1 Tax=Bradymonas sediminis TaxID=1548548 RepID=A0A2Z4FP71_9DELT|nr:serine/threonine-protein kinase [Bradymonas sediminis]AWV90545.1 hypothetical protein DN745_14900 [Bradymonas sediminis]TDP72060.1 serine/threonine protein kinase [Bradymonas sediminis]